MRKRRRARLVGLAVGLAGAHASLEARADGFTAESTSVEETALANGEVTSRWSAYAHVAT
ncbi:MAG: hypothetical protein FJ095_21615, partial [Deltaproteobacteria bacterium]|nr:hypothetical protein [Deltaproteobacteria bacterium]